MSRPDIDIDFADRKAAMASIEVVSAMMMREGKPSAHPSGVYLQDVPTNPFTGLCSFAYDQLDDSNFFKIDFLNQSVYQEVRDEEHLVELLAREPYWELLDDRFFVEQLPHIREHFPIVDSIKPRSIVDLSVVLALIRPGKRSLVGKPRREIDAQIWTKTDQYGFKRSHAVSYAAMIVVKMNLIQDRLTNESDSLVVW
jgi:hypothetical protein